MDIKQNIKNIHNTFWNIVQGDMNKISEFFQKEEYFEKVEPVSEKLSMIELDQPASTSRKVLDLYQDRISISYDMANQKSAPIKDFITHVSTLLGVASPPYYIYKTSALALPYEALVQGLIQTFIAHDFKSFKEYMSHYIAHKIEALSSMSEADFLQLEHAKEIMAIKPEFLQKVMKKRTMAF